MGCGSSLQTKDGNKMNVMDPKCDGIPINIKLESEKIITLILKDYHTVKQIKQKLELIIGTSWQNQSLYAKREVLNNNQQQEELNGNNKDEKNIQKDNQNINNNSAEQEQENNRSVINNTQNNNNNLAEDTQFLLSDEIIIKNLKNKNLILITQKIAQQLQTEQNQNFHETFTQDNKLCVAQYPSSPTKSKNNFYVKTVNQNNINSATEISLNTVNFQASFNIQRNININNNSNNNNNNNNSSNDSIQENSNLNNQPQKMGVFVHTGKKTVFVHMESFDQEGIYQLKGRLERMEGISPNAQKFLFEGQILNDDKNYSLKDLGIKNGDQLSIDYQILCKPEFIEYDQQFENTVGDQDQQQQQKQNNNNNIQQQQQSNSDITENNNEEENFEDKNPSDSNKFQNNINPQSNQDQNKEEQENNQQN